MVNIPTRMRKLNTLLAIRLGPGAAVLPNNVIRIHMEMCKTVEHRGGRKFWRHMLPRLQYHNPSIPMTVIRSEDTAGPGLLSIHLASPASIPTNTTSTELSPTESSTNSATPDEPKSSTSNVLTIDMEKRPESEILARLMELTGAKHVEPTLAEVELMRDLEEGAQKALKDSIRSKAVRAEMKKHQNMLKEARG